MPDSERARGEAAIRTLDAAYDAAWNADGVQALCALLMPDVVAIDPFGGVIEGRDEVGSFFRPLFGPERVGRRTPRASTGSASGA